MSATAACLARDRYLSKALGAASFCCCRYTVGQKFGKHIDDSVEIEGAPGHVTGYTLLVYLSGQQQQGPVDVTAPKAAPISSSNSSAASSKANKRQKQGSAAPAVSSSQPVQVNTNALQNLVGGETVFYGESASRRLNRACTLPGV